jgi:hypothetical protein
MRFAFTPDAYLLLSRAGRIRLGNMVDPKYTMGASNAEKTPDFINYRQPRGGLRL